MILKERAITIATSPEQIWKMMPADKIPEWIPYMAKNKRREYISSVKVQNDKFKVGTTMHFDGTCHWSVKEVIEKRMIKYHIFEKSFLGNLGGIVTFIVEPVKTGCQFTYRTEMDFRNKFVERLIGNPITLHWFEKELKTSLETLKKVLES